MTLNSWISGPRPAAPFSGRQERGPAFPALLAGAALFLAGGAMPLPAQRVRPAVSATIDSVRADGSVVAVPTRKPTTGFNLFAGEDLNCTSYRASGNTISGAMDRLGPTPTNQGDGCIDGLIGNGSFWFFESPLIGGAPPSQLNKIRAVYPGARLAIGNGWTSGYQFVTSTPLRTTIGPADGQFGRTFSGVTTLNDGSCRWDPRNIINQEGFSLMASLDCEVSWGSEGYMGKLNVPDSVWQARFNANPNAFEWNDWDIPRSQLNPTDYLGANNFYSYMSDYFREARLRYGSVIAGGTGAPQEAGYPLGIEFRVDGWQFGSPAVRNSIFYGLTMVNKSAEVYGSGINYDSLYYGVSPGVVIYNQGNSWYFDFGRNTIFMTGRDVKTGNCTTTLPRRYTGATTGCQPNAYTTGSGIMAMTWLKSPIGDMRNKLFTREGGPYFAPNHPNRGDTITFNHTHYGTFGGWNAQFSQRAGFGQISSTEENLLDGRAPVNVSGGYLAHFQPEEYNGVIPDAANAKYNKFVPGSTTNPFTGLPYGRWDYNHDGIQDTISVAGCGRLGCHGLWSDTVAGGYTNYFRNIGNTITAGPFSLASNDTTQFLWAYTWAPDTIEAIRRTDALINSYLGNYEGPQFIALPRVAQGVTYSVTPAELIDSTSGASAEASIGAQVNLRFPQINPTDSYFLRQINRIRQDSINNVGATRRILRLNPGLLDRLTTRARDNLAVVYVFKSCDGGATYTTNSGGTVTSCVDAVTRTVDGGTAAFPYRPLTQVLYTNGLPASGSVTDVVLAGRNYTYVFVTRTRGFSDIRIVDSTSTGLVATDLSNAFSFVFVTDTISSPLSAAGPAAVTVYAPITAAAGRVFARIDTATQTGRATQAVQVAAVSNDVRGTTRLLYANRFVVRKTIDTLTNAATTTVTAQYIVPSGTTSPTGPAVTNFVAREQTFTVNLNIPVASGNNQLTPGTARGTSGSARVYVDTLNAVAGSMGFVELTSDNRPIFVTNSQYGTNFDRYELSSPLYPGFTVRSRDSANASTGFRQEIPPISVTNTLRDRNFVIRAEGDTLQPDARQFTVAVQNIIAGPTANPNPNPKRVRGGAFAITWQADPYGVDFRKDAYRLDPPQELQAALNTALADVARRSTTITDTSARATLVTGATAARPLVRVRVPFTMQYTDAETGQTETVRLAMQRRDGINATRLFGQGNDTLRVNIPDTLWLPGDTLYTIQRIQRDSTVLIGTTRVTVLEPETLNGVPGFRPIQVTVDSVGLFKFTVQCVTGTVSGGTRANAFDQTTCNPLVIGSRGSTPTGGYLPLAAGWKQYFELTRTFDPRSTVVLNATPFQATAKLTKQILSRVSVVPNPYIVRSDLDQVNGQVATARIYFTGVPSEGILRIYTVSGQFLQELTWTAANLTFAGNNSPTGDLPFNLRTREGTDMASGLYYYVLTATGDAGGNLTQRGKFVIIR